MIWFGNLKILRGWNCIASRQESWNINLKDRPQGIDSLNPIQCWIWWSDKVSYSLRITGIKGFCGARIHCRYRNIFKAPNPVIYSRANNHLHGNNYRKLWRYLIHAVYPFMGSCRHDLRWSTRIPAGRPGRVSVCRGSIRQGLMGMALVWGVR